MAEWWPGETNKYPEPEEPQEYPGYGGFQDTGEL